MSSCFRVRRLCASVLHRIQSNNALHHNNTLSAGNTHRLSYTPHIAFSSSTIVHDQEQQYKHSSALYTSYNEQKALRKSQHSNLSSQSRSPLLSHLDLLHTDDNTLKPIDWSNWSQLRELFEQINQYYIRDFCTDFANTHGSNNQIISDDFMQRTQYMLLKTNSGGKNNRGLLHIISLVLLKQKQSKPLTASDVHNAFTLALCIEALQSYFLVMDDVVDGSLTRRGQPCWYRFPNVGLKAINDGPIIETWFFWLINHRLIHDGNRVLIDRINELFREVNMLTSAGQAIDLELVKDANQMKQVYTLQRYETIARYKCSFYSFYLPYAAALYLAGYDDKTNAEHSQLRKELQTSQAGVHVGGGDEVIDDAFLFYLCRKLSVDMGIKFQIDDDYLDCFGDPEVTGKVGTDIQDFKCSWLVVKALELVNEQQYERLKRHYGKDNEDDIEQVKQLYKELGLDSLYAKWETDEHNRLMELVDECEGFLPKKMFTLMLEKLHKRKK